MPADDERATPSSAAPTPGVRAAEDVFVARQPIFDRRKNIYGYELLFRSSFENSCRVTDYSKAARHVLHAAWLDLGIDALVGSARAFLNVTQDVLVSGIATNIPADAAVIELLETIRPDADVIQACLELKGQGYLLALDDFVHSPELAPLVALADIVKIECDRSDFSEQCELARGMASERVTLLAEKVETKSDYERALRLGCGLFQGWFFCRPEIIAGRSLHGSRPAYLKLIHAVSGSEIDLDHIVAIAGSDATISHRLLKFLGSAAFPWRTPIRSVRHALALLGETHTRRWIGLMALDALAVDKPHELLVTAAVRANFCDLLADSAGLTDQKPDLYLLGMLSLIDTMLDQPMAQVLSALPVTDDLRDALNGAPSPLRPVLELVEAFERGDWTALAACCAHLQIEESTVVPLYRSAIAWATKALER